MARVTIVTSGHLATCPRAVKIADTLVAAGHEVRVVSARFIDWGEEADAGLARSRRWKWTAVDYRRRQAWFTHLITGSRWRGSQRAVAFLDPQRAPLYLARRAYARMFPELLRAALAEPADLFYGCSNGGLAPAAAAARAARVPYALDLEDFYCEENPRTPEGRLMDALAQRILPPLLADARFLTAASSAVAQAFEDHYRCRVVTLNNTQPLPAREPDFSPRDQAPLQFKWIGQTLGPGKGLHTVVRALGIADVPAELHLRGRALPEYLNDLRQLAQSVAPSLSLIHSPPSPPDELPDFCRGGDIGIVPVQNLDVLNHQLALPNKAFILMTAGLALALGRSEGYRELAADLGPAAVVFDRDDPRELAAALSRWARDRDALLQARRAAWRAVVRRWHWEHPCESGAMLNAVREALNP